MNRRRFILAGAAAAVSPAIAYAQTAPVAECAIGFVNGLLTMSPDCPLLTPPGIGAGVAPPSHLTMAGEAEEGAAEAEAAAQTAADEEEQRLLEKRSRKDDKKDRRRDNKRDKRGRSTKRQQRKQDGRRTRRDRRNEPSLAESVTCDDFTSKEALDAWWIEYSEISTQLDPNGNGIPCEDVVWPPPPAE